MSLPYDPLVLALVALVGGWGGIWLSRAWRRVVARRRTRRGLRGEDVAVRLLQRRGYTVVETQARGLAPVAVDGQREDFPIRADAIVTKRRRRFVAEFKTGGAASVRNRSTRRQLLEYAVCYDADGVLLVDATRKTIVEIEFPTLS